MIVTANNPLTDPLTLGVVSWAEQVMGGPVHRWTDQLDFSNQPRIAFISHGLGAGILTEPPNADQLLASLTAPGRAISNDTELQLWSCFSTSRKGRASLASSVLVEDTPLVDRVRDGIAGAGITGVTVSGGIGPVYSDVHLERIISGPGIETLGEIKELVKQIEGHCWAQVGIGKGKGDAERAIEQLTKKNWINRGLGECYVLWPEPATSVVTGGPRALRMGLRPDSLAIAAKWHRITQVATTGVDPKTPAAGDEIKQIIRAAVKDWYELFFADPDIALLTDRGYFTLMHDFAQAGQKA